MSARPQSAVLPLIPPVARYLELDLRPGADARSAVARIPDVRAPEKTVLGFGEPLTLAVGARIRGLRSFPCVSGPGCTFPATQHALWAFFAGDDTSDVHDRARAFCALAGDAFVVRDEVPCFRYRDYRDLSGYEDGTENPKDERAVEAAIVRGAGPGLDGSTFVAAQRWVHALDQLAKLAPQARDRVIGRSLATNEELEDAPASAHVKRAAQESYDPAAFMVRRSMPWGGVDQHGLYFVAYGESLDRYERVLRRMSGAEDGIVDGLLSFSRAVSGGYYWCPPVDARGRLDLSALKF
ncbi:MAG TPA: Dyp-type peroxidase [Polyangiaceae bacterium]